MRTFSLGSAARTVAAARPRASGAGRLLATGAALVLGATVATGADLAAVRERGVLRVLWVASTDSQPDPRGPGIDREILDGFAHLQRIRIDVVPVEGYDRLIPALLGGKGDVIAGTFSVTEARKAQVDFTAEVFPSRNVLVSRNPRKAPQTVDELRALTKVGALKGSSVWQTLLDVGIPASALANMSGDVSEDLRTERFQAVLVPVELAITSARTDPELRIGMFVGPVEGYAYGVRKEDMALRQALSEYVTNMRRGLGWNRLVVKYYGEQAAEILRKVRQ